MPAPEQTSAAVESDHVDRFLATLDLPGIDLTVEGIVDRIMGIGRRIKRSMDETLSGFDLTWGEWTVLGTLRHEASHRASPGELARKHELSSGAMTNRLDRLEEAGLVRRLPNVDDRRGVVVELTDEGRRVWHESVDVQAQKEALITAAALEAGERDELNGYLRRLMLAFERSESAEGAEGFEGAEGAEGVPRATNPESAERNSTRGPYAAK